MKIIFKSRKKKTNRKKEPFSLTNRHQVSSQPGLHTWSVWEGELAPPSIGGQGSTSCLWMVHGHDTDGLPTYLDTPPGSAWTTCTYCRLLEGGVLFSCNFSIQLPRQKSALLLPLSHWDAVGEAAQNRDHFPQLLHFSAVLRRPFITQLVGFPMLLSSSQI